MKNLIPILLISLLTCACNTDKTAPTISVDENMFCTAPGESIELTIQIEEENILLELIMTAPDLDFSTNIQGSVIEDNGGMLSVGFVIHPDTMDGTYELNIQAIDDSENISISIVTIKVQA